MLEALRGDGYVGETGWGVRLLKCRVVEELLSRQVEGLSMTVEAWTSQLMHSEVHD